MSEGVQHGSILLVEDNMELATLLTIAIQRQTRYVVNHAGDGNSALAIIEDTEPALLVLDYHLPDTNGLDLYKRIHERRCGETIPTVFTSTDFPRSVLLMERTIHLNKPFSMKQFLDAISRLLA